MRRVGATTVSAGPASMALIAVGRILRPQGRRGEVRLEPLTDEPERLCDLRECHLVPPNAGERRAIERVWFQSGVPILKLWGCESLDEAEALAGRLVAIPRQAVRALPPNRFYAFDLIGCTVETAEGTTVGVLEDVQAMPAHDLWVVRRGARQCLIPAVTAIVERVDLGERRVVVRLPEGLIELDG